MAYFRCSLGGGSGNGAVITVTYGAEFYNQTLVATNGTDTVSVLASSSGTADITVPSEGSWVISCTIGADTYTSDPVSVELSYGATITAIPDGSTVLPTDDIETWLACAQIDNNKNLIKNTATSQTVNGVTFTVNSDGSVTVNGTQDGQGGGSYFHISDYFYGNGNYIINGCPANGSSSTYRLYVWDNDARSEVGSDTGNGASVTLVSGHRYTINIMIGTSQTVSNLIFKPMIRLATDTDDTYVPYRHYTTLAEVLADTDTYTTLLGDSNACDYMARSTTWASTIVADADAMRLLGMYDYACDALLANSTWCTAICGSTYFESVLDVKVPTMTGATTPSGTAFANSEYSSSDYQAWKAFDGSDSTWWGTSNSSSTFTNIYVGYTFTEATVIASYYVKFNTSVTACTYKLQGSNDGTNWTDIGSTNTTLDGYTYVTNDTAYTSYRLFIVSETLDSAKLGGRVLTLQFYGRAEAQTDIIVSAPSDTIYYMDNGSPVTLCTTDASGVGTVDWSDLPTGDITLYSSVAKNPDDLTADYSKTIKVTKNKVEAWLMPDLGVLYWYGYESADLEDVTSANGWSFSGFTQNTPSHKTNYINCSISSKAFCYVAKKDKVDSGTVVKAVVEGVTAYNNIYGFVINTTSKAITSSTISYEDITSNSLAVVSKTTSAQTYIGVGEDCGVSANRACKVHAFWYE